MSRAGSNVLFDSGLATACKEDRAALCGDVEAGSARVIRCLQDHRSSLNTKCAAALFDHEVHISEDIDFNHQLKKTCAYEVSELCKEMPHGHGRIIRCLERELDNTDMSKECKAEVEAVMSVQAKDFRLDTRLKGACEQDINALCAHVCNAAPGQVCGGSVLHCLQENQEKISSQTCQDEVFYFQLMEVKDFRNDVILAQACRQDVETFCKNIEPGDGRVHICLRQNKDQLSEPCRVEETKLAAIEYSDIRLATKLNKLCSEEKAVYCKEVKSGRGRMIKCLLDHMAEPDFGAECKEELQKRDEAMKSDIRYDKAASEKCKADIDTHCKDARMSFRGEASVLKCLVSMFSELQKAHAKSGAAFTIGVVGRCLSKSVVEGQNLGQQCKGLVMAAAPKDVRAYYSTPEASSAFLQTITAMQAATGMGPLLVDQESSVTVSGWLALGCIISLIVVLFGSIAWALKSCLSPDRPHTTYLPVKDGDT
ncbi:hypothetical protein DUNSADRAFT_15858 [Dunaliella salina]|uniref:Golgi apparatus protein 1 n=1 Tax=Dunaliella salina TaxID=3046 RepID=A0ABQ7G4R4_DUNSA|nr:hypothetical protein DUNSADRAFT_15858 [Dunaliella salina]|eukprot:KAF5829593.1 hypothetical protein DUNSADRAFT_15858 [Dunaliella salina]